MTRRTAGWQTLKAIIQSSKELKEMALSATLAAAGMGGVNQRLANGLASEGRLTTVSQSPKERLQDVIQETLKDVISARRRPRGIQQWVSHTCSILSTKKPRLQAATTSLFQDLSGWIQRGGVWRLGLVVAAGALSVIVLGAFCAFMLVVLAATANAAILAFVLCVSAISAFLAFFLTTLSVIYLVSLAVSATFISILTFAAISAAVCITFAMGFLWVVVRSLKFGVQCARTMALTSGEHPMLPPVPLSTTATTPASLNSKGSYAKLDGFDYCGSELDGIVLTKPDASMPGSMTVHPGNVRIDVPADAGAK